MSEMSKLSEDLVPIWRFELSLGNEVARIDEPAGTDCPYAVIFQNPLHIEQMNAELKLAESVEYWESHDPHYPIEAGFVSRISNHAIAGPIGDS